MAKHLFLRQKPIVFLLYATTTNFNIYQHNSTLKRKFQEIISLLFKNKALNWYKIHFYSYLKIKYTTR
jgi:hypothetical protein